MPTPFPVGDVNAFLVEGDALSLFDAGPKTPEAYEALKYGLKKAGYTFKDIEQVFLTHHHPDHAGWIDAFDNAKVLGHSYNDLWLKRDEAFFTYHDAFYLQQFQEAGVPEQYNEHVYNMKKMIALTGERGIDQVLRQGDDIPGHYGWKAIETLGHAQSHLVFWHEREHEMIGGDLILQKVSSNPLIEPPISDLAKRPQSLLQYNASLEKLLTMSIEKVYAGHGNVVKNIHSLVEERLTRQHQRAMHVYELLASGPHTIFELTKTLFPTVFEKELGLTLSETLGQIDYLMDQQMIIKSKTEQGVCFYEQQ